MLSRPFEVPLGEAYKMPDHIAAIDLDAVSLETLSAENLQEEQKECPDVKNHKNGRLPKYVNMSEIKMNSGPTVYCEISGPKARPLLPSKLRTRVLKALHGTDHCGQKELLRRASSEYYWPN